MILSKVRDPRYITIRRGGSLADPDHHLLALWAASCAEHVLDLFEAAQPQDSRPRRAIEHARAWVRGEVKMMQCHSAAGRAMAAGADLCGAPRHAAYAAGQACVVAHVAAHDSVVMTFMARRISMGKVQRIGLVHVRRTPARPAEGSLIGTAGRRHR